MATSRHSISRKLAAIVAADVAGYSRLMSLDESGTVRSLSEARAVFDQLIVEYGGRIANTAGDSVLAEFTNIAARLEAIAEPGGICVSGHVYDQIDGKVEWPIRPLGIQNLKNIARPIDVYAIDVRKRPSSPDSSLPSSPRFKQQVRYCRSSDGVRLAYSVVGSGPPLLKTANWVNHLELDWEIAVFRHLYVGLAKQYTLIRYFVMHFRDDLMQPIAEGRRMAAAIPGARFVSLPGKNHLPLEGDPGMPQFFEEVSDFLNDR